jgi:hypothetical protein
MKKFLIEVPHGADKDACNQAIQVFLQTGSHFLTHAEWGCTDGEHKAWIIVDMESKDEARFIIPPLFRSSAKITELTTFTVKDILEADTYHQGYI